MARPTEVEVDEALVALRDELSSVIAGSVALNRWWAALQTLREAVEPRPVWPVKEAADYLGVRQENLRRLKHPDLPEPAYEFPRPTKADPDRTFRLFWVDEMVAYKSVLEATPRRRNARDKAAKS